MPMVKHDKDKKVSPGGNLTSQDPVHGSDRARIKDLESKLTLLSRKVDNLKYQIKYIADILRKEQSKL